MLALFPVYRLIAWARDNDHVGIERKIEGLQQEQARAHAEVVALDEKWKAEQAAERERAAQAARTRAEEAGTGRKPMTLATLFKSPPAKDGKDAAPPRGKDAPARDGKDAGAREPAAKEAPRAPSGGQAHAPRPAGRARRRARGEAHVRQAAGRASGEARCPASPPGRRAPRSASSPARFAGKVGTIAEMEGARAARVHLGLLSTRLDIGQLKLLDAGAAKAAASAEAAPRKAP